MTSRVEGGPTYSDPHLFTPNSNSQCLTKTYRSGLRTHTNPNPSVSHLGELKSPSSPEVLVEPTPSLVPSPIRRLSSLVGENFSLTPGSLTRFHTRSFVIVRSSHRPVLTGTQSRGTLKSETVRDRRGVTGYLVRVSETILYRVSLFESHIFVVLRRSE